jgi:hypothetical protein
VQLIRIVDGCRVGDEKGWVTTTTTLRHNDEEQRQHDGVAHRLRRDVVYSCHSLPRSPPVAVDARSVPLLGQLLLYSLALPASCELLRGSAGLSKRMILASTSCVTLNTHIASSL